MIVLEGPIYNPLLQHMDRQDVGVAQQAHLPEPKVCPSPLHDGEGEDEEDSPIPDTFSDYNGCPETPATSLNLSLIAFNLPHQFVSDEILSD